MAEAKGAFIRNIAEVPWREFPNHFGGALSKPLVMPETANSRHLDYRISMYQPMAHVARHKHKVQEQIYHVLEGEGLMEIEGKNHVVRKHDVLMSILNWFYVGAIIFAGPLTDRIGAHRAFPGAVAFWSVATALCGLTIQFLPLAILRALVGIGEAPNIPSGSQVIQQNFAKTERGFAVSVQFSGNKVGLAVGIPLAAFLLSQFGRQSVFYMTGLLGAFWVLEWLLIHRRPAATIEATAGTPQSEVKWRELLKVRSVWGMVLGQAGYLYVYYVFATWLPGYLALQQHMSIMSTGFYAMLPFVAGIVFTLVGGWLSDRLVSRGASVSSVRRSFAVGGIFVSTIFIVVAALSHEAWIAIAAFTLAISALSLSTASANAMPIDVAPPHLVSSCAAIQNFGGNIGGALAPLITGLLISWSGSFVVPLLFTAAVGLLFGCGGFGIVVNNLDSEIGEIESKEMSGFSRVAAA